MYPFWLAKGLLLEGKRTTFAIQRQNNPETTIILIGIKQKKYILCQLQKKNR